MRKMRYTLVGLYCVVAALILAGMAGAQLPYYPLTYPDLGGGRGLKATLQNAYIQCNVGQTGTIKAYAFGSDADDGGNVSLRNDKVPDSATHDWGVSGRYGVVAMSGDPELLEDNGRPLTFMGMYPCHYFGYWKLAIQRPDGKKDMRMIGDGGTGGWYRENLWSPDMSPTLYPIPPADLLGKEPSLGRTGPFIRAIWQTSGGNGSTILIEIRVHLVRDMVRFEYRITNRGTVSENIGFCQNGDVEVGDPVPSMAGIGEGYGPYDNANYAYVAGTGAAQPFGKQRAMQFRGQAVPDMFEVYDDVVSPVNVTRNILGLDDATRPDYVAIGEYNDLFHKDMWPPLDYKPDMMHTILDMCWVLVWNQKPLAPNTTRTIVTYYGVGAATSRWTYLSNKTPTRDSALLAVEAPRSLKYDSTNVVPPEPELASREFGVKAWVYNLATDPGPYDPRDVTASIYLPQGLYLPGDLEGVQNNEATKEIGMVDLNSEADPVEWTVWATGECAGELPIYVSVVDNDPTGRHWQQTVLRKITVPAVKRGQFTYGWQLMSVPFEFSNPFVIFPPGNALGLTPGTFSAQYWNGFNTVPLDKFTPGQGFWMRKLVNAPTWQHPQTFNPAADAVIVGRGQKQVLPQSINLTKGWNMIGNPFVYPLYWKQVMVWSAKTNTSVPMDEAVAKGWLDSTLFAWNTDKWDYDILRNSGAMLVPWKGYWVYARSPVRLILQPPVLPNGDVTANTGGR